MSDSPTHEAENDSKTVDREGSKESVHRKAHISKMQSLPDGIGRSLQKSDSGLASVSFKRKALKRRSTVTTGEDLDALVRRKKMEQMRSQRRASLTQNLMDGNLDIAINQSYFKEEEVTSGSEESDEEQDDKEDIDKKHDADAEASRKSQILLAVGVVVFGCACQAPFEALNKYDRGCGDLISVTQYVYGLVASAPGAMQGRAAAGGWKISWLMHFGLAVANLGYFVMLNIVLATSLPLPVIITMKNGNLVANLVVGVALMRRKYNFQQVTAVLVVTGGLVLTALTGTQQKAGDGKGEMGADALLGVALLFGALVARALNGALQEMCRDAPVSELLFMGSGIGLPFFALKGNTIFSHVTAWNLSETGGLVWPSMWLLLLANLVFDYLMKVVMTKLIGATSALTATMVLTAQRFIAFVLSALVLNPSPGGTSPALWFGSALILLGTLAYSTAGMKKAQVAEQKKNG